MTKYVFLNIQFFIFHYPSIKAGRPSNISSVFPAEREALLRLASRNSKEGSKGSCFFWIPKCLTRGVSWRIIYTKESFIFFYRYSRKYLNKEWHIFNSYQPRETMNSEEITHYQLKETVAWLQLAIITYEWKILSLFLPPTRLLHQIRYFVKLTFSCRESNLELEPIVQKRWLKLNSLWY